MAFLILPYLWGGRVMPYGFGRNFCCLRSNLLSLRAWMQPIFLNEVMVRKSPDEDPDGTIFHLNHIEHLYSLRAPTTNERSVAVVVVVLVAAADTSFVD